MKVGKILGFMLLLAGCATLTSCNDRVVNNNNTMVYNEGRPLNSGGAPHSENTPGASQFPVLDPLYRPRDSHDDQEDEDNENDDYNDVQDIEEAQDPDEFFDENDISDLDPDEQDIYYGHDPDNYDSYDNYDPYDPDDDY